VSGDSVTEAVTGDRSAKRARVLEGYRFIKDQRVAFRDLDYFRHVNNAAYVTWTETIRIEYMVEVVKAPLDAQVGIIMASQRFEYAYPVGPFEDIAVGIRCSRLGTKSLDFEYEIYSRTAATLAVRGFNAIVAYDYGAGKSVAIPPPWRDAILAFEPGLQA
jgi:acyl-CoA thioester hydrolase